MPRVLLVVAFAAPVLLSAQPAADALAARLASRIAAVPGATVGVHYRDLSRGTGLDLDADRLFHAASTMKLPVLIEYARAVDRGDLAADARVPLLNRFASIVDGSPYSLSAGDDSDSALYALVGQPVAVRDLVERMITRSSNLATNVMIARLGAGRVQATARGLGADSLQVLRGVEDGPAFRAGLNNRTSARDLGALLAAIAAGRAASPAATRTMLDILERQAFNDEIPAGLPPGTRVAHKTGWITGVLHDAALVSPDGAPPFVLVVLTAGIPEVAVARALIADLARIVWAHHVAAPAGRD